MKSTRWKSFAIKTDFALKTSFAIKTDFALKTGFAIKTGFEIVPLPTRLAITITMNFEPPD